MNLQKLLTLTLTLTLLIGCGRSEEEEAYLRHLEEGAPIKEAFDVRFIFSEKAVIQATLEAPHAIEAKEGEEDVRIFDKGMKLEFFTKEGEPKSSLTSDNGKFKNQFNEAEVWGNVVMFNINGDKLETERLFWNKKTEKIHTNEFVKIRTATEVIYGDSMDANTDFTEYKIYNIRGSIQLKDEEL